MYWRLKRAEHLLVLTVSVAVAFVTTARADILHVPGDFPTIQEAIDAAVDGDEVEVHPGTYNEAINFLGKAIRVYSTDGPDVTIIDAQQTGTVVTCDSAEGPDSVLEGFTITGGSANSGGGMFNDGSSPTVTNCIFTGNITGDAGDGAGIYNINSNPTVTNCIFAGNITGDEGDGGGMYNNNSNPTVTDCIFTGNTPVGGNGGGMYNNNSDPTVTDCIFTGNTADQGGGMVNNLSSSPTVTNCTFSGNTAFDSGGGMYNSNDSSPTVTNCTFSENSTNNGGGMNNQGSSATVTDCIFTGNTAGRGGGMRNYGGSPTVINCTFSGNTVEGNGGAIANNGGSPTITNCTFAGNAGVGLGGGGAISSVGGSTPVVTNCTFSGNTATIGGAMFADDFSTPIVTNCILWNNTLVEIFDGIAITTVRYTDIEGGWSGEGSNNIDADPLFVDPDNDDYHILPSSPCIDAADNTAVPKGVVTDLGGNPRFVDDPDTEDTGFGDPPIVDMGAYEFQVVSPCPWDFDNSGDVGVKDLLFLLGSWGPCPTKGDCPADFDNSGDVGVKDLLFLLGNWGPCP